MYINFEDQLLTSYAFKYVKNFCPFQILIIKRIK